MLSLGGVSVADQAVLSLRVARGLVGAILASNPAAQALVQASRPRMMSVEQMLEGLGD